MEEPCYAANIPFEKYDSSLSHVSFFLLLLTPFQFCNSGQPGMEVLLLYIRMCIPCFKNVVAIAAVVIPQTFSFS